MRGFSDRPKSMGPGLTGKRALTIEDVPKRTQPPQEISNMRRANTNDSLVSMELAALSSTPPSASTPPDHAEWAQKQLMGMVNRSADGNRVVGEEESNFTPPMARSAFSKHQSKSTYVTPPEHASPLASSQPLSPTSTSTTFSRTLSPSNSTSSLFPVGGGNGTLRRERTTILENRLRLKREKDQHMARMIMEEENKKVKDKDKEKLRETEEKLKAKEIREQQEQRLQSYYEQLHEKQQQHTPPQSSSEADNTYLRFRKKIKDIKVKPTLPSVNLDEKLKNFNARVKGFLSTTNPLPIQKFREKRNSKHARNTPIKLNIVDDFMKDLEMQRLADETALDRRLDALSPASPVSSDSSPADLQKKQAARSKRLSSLRLANRTSSELQLLIRALDRNLRDNNEAITAAHETCVKIRAEMEKTKTLLTVDIEAASSKVERAGMRGTQFTSTVQEIKAQLDATRNATSACSDKIKSLEVNVQKVKRAKKPTDKIMRYMAWSIIGILLLYLIVKSRTVQILMVISVFVVAMKSIKERSGYIPASQHLLTKFMEVVPPPIEEEDSEELSSPEIQPPMTPSGTHVAPSFSSPKQENVMPSISSMRRNHSDLVLQSLLNEEQFADVFHESPKLRTVKEDEDYGISPVSSSSSSNRSGVTGSVKVETMEKSGSGGMLRPTVGGNSARPSSASSTGGIRSSGSGNAIRTSVTTKDSVAMNLALHNLNQMSLKIQQMQGQGK